MGYIGFDDLRVVLGINEKTDSSVVQKGPKFLTRLGDTAILIVSSRLTWLMSQSILELKIAFSDHCEMSITLKNNHHWMQLE